MNLFQKHINFKIHFYVYRRKNNCSNIIPFMSDPRKSKSSRKGTPQTNIYSSVLGDPLHLVDKKDSEAQENHPKSGHFLTGGRRSSDRDTGELRYLWNQLSPREQDVTVLVCRGFTNEQIARTLHISVSSVKTYLRFVFATLNVENRTELRLKFYNFDFKHDPSPYFGQ